MAAPQHQVSDPYEHVGPWSDEDFLALPGDRRVELVDGALVMSPRASNPHQRLAYRLWGALDDAATPGHDVLGEPNVRLGAVVPKRHARRAVTRTLLKRQIRSVALRRRADLRAGIWVVRLRSPFDRTVFVSAASDALRASARAELERAFEHARPSGG